MQPTGIKLGFVTMFKFRATEVFAVVGSLVICSAIANAQVTDDTPKPPDSVRCVIEAIGPEQRENANILLVTSLLQNEGLGFVREEMTALLKDAHNLCLDHYPWSSGQSEAAINYAMFELISAATKDSLENAGLKISLVDDFYRENRSLFTKASHSTEKHKTLLKAFLTDKDWPHDDEKAFTLATQRLDMLIVQSSMEQLFKAHNW